MVLFLDNYDSFVHNLARYFQKLGQETCVVRSDAISPDEARALQPAAIVISPGPCTPREAGCSLQIVRQLGATIPILGVCLGHQTLAEALGGHIERAALPWHGRTSDIHHYGHPQFAGVPTPFQACRYHSLVVAEDSLPAELEVTARTSEGVVMALAHRQWPVWGVQFHPEAILTDYGYPLLANFLKRAGQSLPKILPSSERPANLSAVEPTLPKLPVTF